MNRDSYHDIARALAEILHEELARKQAVEIPDWGTFSIEHETGRVESIPEGRTALHPPQDTITFEPQHA
jgi:nucleoid DNA-binding protein